MLGQEVCIALVDVEDQSKYVDNVGVGVITRPLIRHLHTDDHILISLPLPFGSSYTCVCDKQLYTVFFHGSGATRGCEAIPLIH